MILVWFEICGYKRFAAHTKVNLAEKLVAIVGPNEAGKTSLLRSLLHLNNSESFVSEGGSQELTRGRQVEDNQSICEWTFAIDDGDREDLKEIPEAENLRWYSLEKRPDGQIFYNLTPKPEKTMDRRVLVRNEIDAAIRELPKTDTGEINRESELLDKLKQLSEQLESLDQKLPDNVLALMDSLLSELQENEETVLLKRLSELVNYELIDDPSARVASILSDRRPSLLLFGDADRALDSEYDLNSFFRKENPQQRIHRLPIPIALENLARASKLNLEALHLARTANDPGKVKTILEEAENTITNILQNSWTQSTLKLSLELSGHQLQILLKSDSGEYVNVVERSDGLRQFVALLLFLARQQQSDIRPILLIDEVESRLHYDAQADLIQVLAMQTVVSKVVYTTHSIGCLPEDLGSGIRMVATEGQFSVIENYFWQSERPGFSPLLFSMGAQTLAFLPIRYAVIAEGAADLILVPAILKETLRLESLGFQVVPGLSSAKTPEIAILDNESTRTGYLVDGDSAGRRIASKIRQAGVSEDKIVALPFIDSDDTVIEDYLNVEVYVDAVNIELRRSGSQTLIAPCDLNRPNRPKKLEQWCQHHKTPIPSKRAVAYHVVENKFDNNIVDPVVEEQVKQLNTLIVDALKISSQLPIDLDRHKVK